MSEGLEHCFYVEAKSQLNINELNTLLWLIAETFEPHKTGYHNHLGNRYVVQIGPRLSIETPFSSNAVSICQACGLDKITRVEVTRIYTTSEDPTLENLKSRFHFDRMTEEVYPKGIHSFETGIKPEPVQVIDLIGCGKSALVEVNKRLGLGMDDRDLDYYQQLFAEVLGRNPTDVELFQLGNANSEHSRHGFFNAIIEIDGTPMEQTLFQIVKGPLKNLGPDNRSLVAFHDNAGVIKGFETDVLIPVEPGKPSSMHIVRRVVHITCTAETHNHPTFVAPFPGAQTGAGGRIRDNSAVGRGGIIGIGIAGYAVGNLFIPGYEIPGEVVGRDMPSQYASPLKILIDGSNGVTSYGNEIGEPLTSGFTRSFGQFVNGEWREFRKPILYSAGVGHIFKGHTKKEKPEVGMLIVRIGGPAYPIGIGGGAASSMQAGDSTEELDFSSVQRGNAEMENRTNRVIRTCMELGKKNPIRSAHDQGAGGPSNVITELVVPLGGKVNIRRIRLGDITMSVLEIWSAEFQEGYGLLISSEDLEVFLAICKRERVNCEILGEIDGNGHIVVEDPEAQGETVCVNLNLEQILTKLPQKTFKTERQVKKLQPFVPPDVSIGEMIEAVFAQLHVGSKGFLVHKGDRCVTGLVAQQQCCGPAQIPIANVSINMQSHFGLTGAVQAIGEQPIKMLINAGAGARMSIAEMFLKMSTVKITSIGDIRCRVNCMWPAKLPGEGAEVYDAYVAEAALMQILGIAADGGKDSLSMAANAQGKLVKAPGSLVVLGYAPVEDVTKRLTPDIKCPGESYLGLVDLGLGKNRMGGSALAQANNQIGDDCPDVDDPVLLKNVFLAVQELIDQGLILSQHHRSDGGLITAVSEMCMASSAGFTLCLRDPDGSSEDDPHMGAKRLFSEELGLVWEFMPKDEKRIKKICSKWGIPFQGIGLTADAPVYTIWRGSKILFESRGSNLRKWWEATSHQLERLQTNPKCKCTDEEYSVREDIPNPFHCPSYRLNFEPRATAPAILESQSKPKVAVIREEGTNGDIEMSAAFVSSGFDATVIPMSDFLSGEVDSLDRFQGVAFAGGFSFKDTFGSAKGWAATIQFNPKLNEMFNTFYTRKDTFSLGVCNGCQLMALLGWVPMKGIAIEKQPRFVHNTSGRFECRWTQVEILKSRAVLLSGMTGSRLGVWVAHGEGRLVYPDVGVKAEVESRGLAPLAYVDHEGQETDRYPYNPNGSPEGVTALCSPDGRHLAMMPHPERCFRLETWPWMPNSWRQHPASPWLTMFQNAREWCLKNR